MDLTRKLGNVARVAVAGSAIYMIGCNATGDQDARLLGLVGEMNENNTYLEPNQRAALGTGGRVVRDYGTAEAGKSNVTQNNFGGSSQSGGIPDSHYPITPIGTSSYVDKWGQFHNIPQ